MRVYVWAKQLVQRGVDIDGEAEDNYSGYSVSSADGSIVAIGAIDNDEMEPTVAMCGYTWDGSSWVQRGGY